MRKVIVNFSGGKDSTVAALEALKAYPKDEILLCYQDTGAEYAGTAEHVHKLASMLELPLLTLKNNEDWYQLTERKGYFANPFIRHCTGELKKNLFDKWVRENREKIGNEAIIVYGIRGEESQSRSKLPEWDLHQTTLKNGKFTAKIWRPILSMRKQEVFERIRAEGLPLHYCYDFSTRCNCWMCFFAHPNEVRAYAEVHPEEYEKACLLEDKIKHKWKAGFAINDLMKQGRLI